MSTIHRFLRSILDSDDIIIIQLRDKYIKQYF